ncbi:MAG: hypothetical protein BM557_09385 [Flavobacterium sp. MedPE-SWcel]|uniref:DUF3822 family protein n=1 Tax=uncultured Flavobacterium sp. TaxID=165435 RepID=UPI00091A14DB|nr:DUF3822 family protein [uncultured Flavobacterium sp.]OIQ16946.1 MAG: hypothetical protein BM557_09385 [Flavobacterium sp. MedPE-SWcel]
MNTTITTKNYKKLVLQIGLGGMSFCIINTIDNTLSEISSSTFSKFQPIEDELWKLFVEHPELKMEYDDIVVLHDNSLNTFVPHALFDEKFLGSYLQYNTKVFDTDFFTYDILGNYDINNVHVPQVNINNYLIDRFGMFDYKNANSLLVARLLDSSKNIDEKQVFVHMQKTHFEIVVVQNQKLLLYNSFEYNISEDFLYYLLFTMEQLLLNPETVKVVLLGEINKTNPCYTLAYTYIRNISFLDTEALQEKYKINSIDATQHYILLNA